MRTLVLLLVLSCAYHNPHQAWPQARARELQQQERGQHEQKLARAQATWLIPKEARFRPESEIIVSTERDDRSDETRFVQEEVGIYNGVAYHFSFTDGAGFFTGEPRNPLDGAQPKPNWANWKVRCMKDPLNDRKSCVMHAKELWILVTAHKPAFVFIGHQHYPGSSVAIRINQEKPFVAHEPDGFGWQISARIIQKLKANPQVVTRYTKWPNTSPTDETFQVLGFPETYEYLHWAVQQIK